MLRAGGLKDFRLIKSQDRQALYLKARLGFRYNEIAALRASPTRRSIDGSRKAAGASSSPWRRIAASGHCCWVSPRA